MPKTNAFGHRQWTAASPSISTRTIILTFTIIFLILFFSTLIFIFQEVALNVLDAHVSNYELEVPDNVDLGFYLLRIKATPTTIMLAISWISGALAGLSGLAFWELRNTDRWSSAPSRMKTWTWVNVLSNVLNFGLVAACLAIVFAQEYSNKDLVLPKEGEVVEHRVEATRETLMCKLKDIEGWNAAWANVGCGFALAGRWIMVPLAMSSAALLAICLHQVWRWRFTRPATS
jgi:hypothetical protein